MPDDGYSTKVSTWRANRMMEIKAIADSVLEHFEDNLLIVRGVDYGCNDGAVQTFFEDYDIRFSMIGADVNPAALDKAHKQGRNVVAIKQGWRTPMITGKYHFVTCLMTIAHVIPQRLALEEMRRLLCKDGVLVIETPHPMFDRLNILSILWHGYQGDYTINKKLSPKQLIEMIGPKMRVVKFERTGRRLPRILSWLPITSDYRITLVHA